MSNTTGGADTSWFEHNMARIRRAIADSGRTYEAIGKAAGLSSGQVYNVAKGLTANPGVRTVMRLATSLGLVMEDPPGGPPEGARWKVVPIAARVSDDGCLQRVDPPARLRVPLDGELIELAGKGYVVVRNRAPEPGEAGLVERTDGRVVLGEIHPTRGGGLLVLADGQQPVEVGPEEILRARYVWARIHG